MASDQGSSHEKCCSLDEVGVNDQTFEGCTPMHCLLKSKSLDPDKKLRVYRQLSGLSDVNLGDHAGVRPLHLVGQDCNLVLLQRLIESEKADALAVDAFEGQTVMHFIAESQESDEQHQIECMTYLQKNADPQLLSVTDMNDLLPFVSAIIHKKEGLALEMLKFASKEEINRPAKAQWMII